MEVQRIVFERPSGMWGWRIELHGEPIAINPKEGYATAEEARVVADRLLSGHYYPMSTKLIARLVDKPQPDATT